MPRSPVKRPARRPKPRDHGAIPWWRPTLTNGQDDWREYLLWQVGLLVTALSILYVLLLFRGLPAVDPSVLDRAVLVSLAVDLAACVILWRLIDSGWSRSKRFALGFMILADVFVKLWFLRSANSGDPFDTWWYLALLAGTGLYLAGTGVIGLIVWWRGDDVSPWWRS